MIDLDIISDLDPTTGLPVVDHRSRAQRRLDAIHDGPENHGATNVLPHFDPVGAEKTTEKLSVSDQRSNKNTKTVK